MRVSQVASRADASHAAEHGSMNGTKALNCLVNDAIKAEHPGVDLRAHKEEFDRERNRMIDLDMRGYLNEAWKLLTDRQQREVADVVYKNFLRYVADVRGKALMADVISRLVNEELARREDELRSRITGEVNDRWEAMVAEVVESKVRAAIDKIKAEIVR